MSCQFSKGSKIKPFLLKSPNGKVKKLSCKISSFADIIFQIRMAYLFSMAVFRNTNTNHYEKE